MDHVQTKSLINQHGPRVCLNHREGHSQQHATTNMAPHGHHPYSNGRPPNHPKSHLSLVTILRYFYIYIYIFQHWFRTFWPGPPFLVNFSQQKTHFLGSIIPTGHGSPMGLRQATWKELAKICRGRTSIPRGWRFACLGTCHVRSIYGGYINKGGYITEKGW